MGLVGRARPWIAAWVLLVASCASVDPNVFNEALRTATFRAYLGAIEAQFGGLEAAGVTAGELRDRYRKRAMAAQSPESFYRVLSEMLADLDDPHAVMRVSPRFWDAPVAEPEWSQFVMSRGSVWVGLPRRSVRSPEDYAESLGVWLRPFGGKPLGEFEPLEIAALLRRSAAFSGRGGLASAREPLAWLRLRAIDGIEIESPHDAELVCAARSAPPWSFRWTSKVSPRRSHSCAMRECSKETVCRAVSVVATVRSSWRPRWNRKKGS